MCIKHQPKPPKIHVPLMHFNEIGLFSNLPLRGIETEKSALLKGSEFHQILEDALSVWYTKYDQKSNIFNRGHIYLSETVGCAKSKPVSPYKWNFISGIFAWYYLFFKDLKKNYGFLDFLFFMIFSRQAVFSVKA